MNDLDAQGLSASGCAHAIIGLVFAALGLGAGIGALAFAALAELPTFGASTIIAPLGVVGVIAGRYGTVHAIRSVVESC